LNSQLIIEKKDLSIIYGKNIRWKTGQNVGQGSSGEVFTAWDVNKNRMIIVKRFNILHPFFGYKDDRSKRLIKEIKVTD